MTFAGELGIFCSWPSFSSLQPMLKMAASSSCETLEAAVCVISWSLTSRQYMFLALRRQMELQSMGMFSSASLLSSQLTKNTFSLKRLPILVISSALQCSTSQNYLVFFSQARLMSSQTYLWCFSSKSWRQVASSRQQATQSQNRSAASSGVMVPLAMISLALNLMSSRKSFLLQAGSWNARCAFLSRMAANTTDGSTKFYPFFLNADSTYIWHSRSNFCDTASLNLENLSPQFWSLFMASRTSSLAPIVSAFLIFIYYNHHPLQAPLQSPQTTAHPHPPSPTLTHPNHPHSPSPTLTRSAQTTTYP